MSVFGISTFFVIRDVYRSKTEDAANRELSSIVNDLKDDARRHRSRNDGTDETEGETGNGEEDEDPYTEDGILKAAFQVPFGTAALAATLLTVLGVVAGLMPALRAMQIKPVDAMRDE